MTKSLLNYYNDELSDLHEKGSAFADNHPNVAANLRLGAGAVDDPLVARLMESFAFLTARVQRKIDDEMCYISQALLNILYPHYLAPMPSFSLLQFQPQSSLQEKHEIAKHTPLVTHLQRGEPCFFRTAYPVSLWPIQLESAALSRRWAQKPTSNTTAIKACLRLQLSTSQASQSFSTLKPQRLRFYVGGEKRHAALLHELMCQHVECIMLSDPASKDPAIEIPPSNVQAVGFDDDDALLPYPPQAFSGYRLLSEYFFFPEKFLFVDIYLSLESFNKTLKNKLEIHLYFNRATPALEPQVNASMMKLYCTPIVNLFEKTGEPIHLDHKQSAYHVIADAHCAARSIEVYRILAVEAMFNNQQPAVKCEPYFGRKFSTDGSQARLYWSASRQRASDLGQQEIMGDEIFLSISALSPPSFCDEPIVLSTRLLCTNRDLPVSLPFGGGQPVFTFSGEGRALVHSMRCVHPITAPHYRDHEQASKVELISHIAANQLGFGGNGQVLETLRSILSLYHYGHSDDVSRMAKGLVRASTKICLVRHPDKLKYSFCQGVVFTLEIDENYFPENTALLFARVLGRFLAISCAVNTFCQLILISQQRGEIYRCKPQLGAKRTL
jgi:type VI secretion system protein ImpG